MPMMPFIGVRISWLMLARNSLLARVAASAASLARTSSRSACFRSVMSVKLTTAPLISPSPPRSGYEAYSAGKAVPSRRHRTSSSTRHPFPTRKVR